MNTLYQISVATNISDSLAIPSLHDSLTRLGVKHWDLDFKNRMLTLRTELPDFKRVRDAIQSLGFICKLKSINKIKPGTNG